METAFPVNLHCVPIQYPNGRWGFAGRVPAELAFTAPDGGAPDPVEIAKACSFGPRFANLKTRTFATKDEALAALAEVTA